MRVRLIAVFLPAVTVAAVLSRSVGPVRAQVATPAFVQAAGSSVDGQTHTQVRLRGTRAGATLVVCVGTGVPIGAIADDRGSSYELVGAAPNSSGAGTLSVYVARPTAPVRSIRVDHEWGSADVTVAEYRGALGVESAAVADSGYNTGSSWIAPPVAVTSSPTITVGCGFEVYGAAATVTLTPTGGFRQRASTRGMLLADRAVAAPGSVAAAGTRLPADNLNIVAATIVLRTASSFPTTTTTPTTTTPTTTTPTTTTPTTTTTAATTTTTTPPTGSGPRVVAIDVESGPRTGGPGGLGAPITILGRGFGSTRGSSTVTIGGVEVARYLVWGERNANNPNLDMIVVQPGGSVAGGVLTVTVNGVPSNTDTSFTPNAGNVFVIAPSGADANPCTEALPCVTVQHVATDLMRPGDVVLARGGTYTESEVWIRAVLGHSGTPGARKVIAAYPGEAPVFVNADRPFIVDADYITVSGLHFRNGKPIGMPDSGLPGRRANKIINNTFTGLISWAAVDTHGDAHTLVGNYCDVSGSTVGTQGHCFYISYGNGVRVSYNVAGGAPGYGIHVFDQQRSVGDFQRTIRGLVIEGNVLRSSTQRSGLILAMGDEGNRGNIIDGVTVRDNTMTGNNHLGMVIGEHVRNVSITGNRFDQNGRQGLYVADSPTIANITVSGNTFVQSANTVCTLFCSWYEIAHIQRGPQVQGMTISGNRYEPAPPIIIGGADPNPSSG